MKKWMATALVVLLCAGMAACSKPKVAPEDAHDPERVMDAVGGDITALSLGDPWVERKNDDGSREVTRFSDFLLGYLPKDVKPVCSLHVTKENIVDSVVYTSVIVARYKALTRTLDGYDAVIANLEGVAGEPVFQRVMVSGGNPKEGFSPNEVRKACKDGKAGQTFVTEFTYGGDRLAQVRLSIGDMKVAPFYMLVVIYALPEASLLRNREYE